MLYRNIFSWQNASIVNWSILSISHRNSDILKNVNCREKVLIKYILEIANKLMCASANHFKLLKMTLL